MPDATSAETTTPIPSSPRRTFVARVAGILAAWPLLGRVSLRRGLAEVSLSDHRVPPPNAALGALADAVLPSELGSAGAARASSEFQQWMDGYQPGAEANHGYGTGKIERLPADPRPAWHAQLAALDAEARRAGGQSFASLPRDRRQALVRTVLAGERGEALPNPLAARHIALALLAHFYDSPAATDLCYNAEIGRQLCRPLAAQQRQPVPLGRRTS
jgi:gluconate 2-dehydrogenase subunit 3-like protein